MKTLVISTSTACFLLVTVVAFAQVHRDTDPGNSSYSFDIVAVGVGVVIGLIIGYVIGTRSRRL